MESQNSMKQHITKEQFDELTNKQKNVLYLFVGERSLRVKKGEASPYLGMPNIGTMIEFLGEQCWSILRLKTELWSIHDNGGLKYFREKELCDALWEAVKNKLNAKTSSTEN